MSLSSLIVQREIATIRQVEEALARQVLYGGDLVTNLLEVAPIEEWRIATALAESFEMPPAPAGPLPDPPESLRSLVPGELAARRSLLPLEFDGHRLVVAVAEPLGREEEEQLGFALGARVEQRIALHVRIRETIARVYGAPLDRRVERLLARLAGREASLPSSRPPLLQNMPEVQPPPRPASVPPFRLSPAYGVPAAQRAPSSPPESELTPSPAPVSSQAPDTLVMVQPPALSQPAAPPLSASPAAHRITAAGFPAPQPSGGSPGATPLTVPPPTRVTGAYAEQHATFVKATSNVVRPVRRRRGPVTLDQAKEELEQAQGRDDLLDLYFEFARQYFDYSAFFVAHGDIAEGRDAYGEGAPRERVVGIGVPLDLPSMLATARDHRAPTFARPSAEGVDGILLGDLQRHPGVEVLLLPVMVRNRVVAIFYGDGGAGGVDRTTASDVIAFAQLVGQGFERLIVRKKLGGYTAGSPDSTAGKLEAAPLVLKPKRPVSSPPTKAARAATLGRALLGQTEGESRPAASERPGAFRPEPAAPTSAAEPAPEAAPPIAAPDTSGAASAWNRPAPTRPETPQALGHVPPVIGSPSSPPPSPTASQPTPLPPAIARRRSSQPPPPLAEMLGQVTELGPPPEPNPGQRVKMRASKPPPPNLDVRRPSGPPIPREEPDSPPPPGIGNAIIPPNPVPRSVEGHGAPSVETSAMDEAEEQALLAEIGEIDATAYDEHGIPVDGVPPAPPSESIVVGPRHPPRAHSVAGLPTIIVDIDQELLFLVDRVLSGKDDGQAEGELLRQGAQAMHAIMSRFPGPIALSRNDVVEPLPRVSECGPLLRLVARERRVALPYVTQELSSADVSRRFWATFLVTELAYPEAVPSLVPRLYDPDPKVRLVARAASRALVTVAQEPLLAEMGRLLREPSTSRSARLGLLEALGDMREALAVPLLMRTLADQDAEVATVARRSLIAITRQDFALDQKGWLAWWGQNSNRHRIEWLIDALVDETPGIRKVAGEELKQLTSETFGYYDDLPKRERERAQQRFRDWWASEGRARYVR